MTLEKIVANLIQKMERRFYGKYRGFVVDNNDPEHLGRLKLSVPSVLGNVVTGWAMPCVPYGGEANTGFLYIPEKKSGVWVEFEEGDLEFPIWTGTFWSKPGGASELPIANNPDGSEQASVQEPPTCKIIKTKKGHTIQLEDKDGDEMVTIVSAHDGKKNVITLNSKGITIFDGNGNEIIMASGGIKIGSSSASEPFVLGNTFKLNVQNLISALASHTHTGNLGAPTSPPMAPLQLDVPLSTKHKVE